MNYIKKLTKAREASSLLFLIALFIIVGCINTNFLAPSSIAACFNDSVVFTLLAVGMYMQRRAYTELPKKSRRILNGWCRSMKT